MSKSLYKFPNPSLILIRNEEWKSLTTQNTYKVRLRRLCTTRTMESKLALLIIVGLLFAVHQTFAGESQYLLFRASAIGNDSSDESRARESQDIDIRPSDPLNWSKESEVISVLQRPHMHFNEGWFYFRDVVEDCFRVSY